MGAQRQAWLCQKPPGWEAGVGQLAGWTRRRASLGKGSEVCEAPPAPGWGWGQMLWGEAGGGPPVSHPVTLNSDEGGDGV